MSNIFLSHIESDHAFSVKLANDLRRASLFVWEEKAQMAKEDSLAEKINTLEIAPSFVGIILSKDSTQAAFASEELDTDAQTLVILTDDIPVPGALKSKPTFDFASDDTYKDSLVALISTLSALPKNVTATGLTTYEISFYEEMLTQVKQTIAVSRGEKRRLLEQMEQDGTSLTELLHEAIAAEEALFPAFCDINRLYAFGVSGQSVTAGFLLREIRRELNEDGPHVLEEACRANHKLDKLAILIEVTLRRLQSLEK